jgi:hypothetical protein
LALSSCAGDERAGAGASSTTVGSLPPEVVRTDPGPERSGVADVDDAAGPMRDVMRAGGHSEPFARCVGNEVAQRFRGTELRAAVGLLSVRDPAPAQITTVFAANGVDEGRAVDLLARLASVEDLCRSLESAPAGN